MIRQCVRKIVACSIVALFIVCVFPPALSLAQDDDDEPPAAAVSTAWFDTFITQSGTLVNATMPVLIALAFFVLLWGIVKFISASGNEAKIEDGKRIINWGVLSLFVIVSVWGILTLVRQLTGVGAETATRYPDWK